MAQINKLGAREIISLLVNGVSYADNMVETVYFPDNGRPFWEISLKDGTTINATGNIFLQFRS